MTSAMPGAMVYQLSYKATQLGALVSLLGSCVPVEGQKCMIFQVWAIDERETSSDHVSLSSENSIY